MTNPYAWLIERADSEPSAPKYWSAGVYWSDTSHDRASRWTSNHDQAIRFARREDAERVAKRLLTPIAVRICEHSWCGTHDRDPVDDWEATYRYCEREWQSERKAFFAKIAKLSELLRQARSELGCHCHGATGSQLKLREAIGLLLAPNPDPTPQDPRPSKDQTDG